MGLMAEVLDIQPHSAARLHTRGEEERPKAKLGRPEVIPEKVRWQLRAQYLDKHRQWGPSVLANWAKREGLGEYSPSTIDRAIQDLKEPKPEKKKPTRYEITAPMVMWSEDGTGFTERGKKKELLVLQDEHSRFKLNHSLADGPAEGEDVVDYLRQAFDREGVPLVLKQDGAKIFLTERLLALLDEYGVLLLTSPPYYPGYNGKKERSMRDIKSYERAVRKCNPYSSLTERIDEAIHDLNYDRPRPMLGGRTAKEAFEQGRCKLPDRVEFGRKVDAAEQRNLARARSRDERSCARRKAIEEVLSSYGLLETMADVTTNYAVGSETK